MKGGKKTFGASYEKSDKPKEIADNIYKYLFFSLAYKNNSVPRQTKKSAIDSSKPWRDMCIAHGFTAIKSAATAATPFDLNNLLTIKKRIGTINTPNIAEGILSTKIFRPKTLISGMIKYI